MGPINILSVGSIYIYLITCFEIRTSKNEKTGIMNKHRELNEDILNEYLCVSFGPKIKICRYALDSIKNDVKLESFRITKPDMAEMWKKRLEGAIWTVSHSKSDTFINEKSYKLNVVWSVDNLECYFCMEKNDLINIFIYMCKYENNEIIKFIIKTPDKLIIPIYSIQCISRQYILFYQPLLSNNEFNFIDKIIEGDIRNYYESYTNYLFFLFRNIREKIESNELEIYNLSNDVIIFNFTNGKVPLLLCAPQYIPNLKFFGDFSIKLGYLKQKVPNDQEITESFKNISPNIFLKFKRLAETLDNNLNIQINLYYRNIKNQDRPPKKFRKPLYLNLNFSPEKTISFKKQLIDTFIKFKEGKSGAYDFTLYFLKASYITKFRLKRGLLNSIKKISIKTFGKTVFAIETLDVTRFRKKSRFYPVKLKFNISKDTNKEPNKANNIIYDILERKTGYFSVQVQTIDKTLIEYKVNLTPEHMCVLTCNRLDKHIEIISNRKNYNIK